MEITGEIKKIFDTQTKGNFTFREMVITTEEQYPQDIIIQFTQDKINLLSSYKIGEKLKVFINIRGREWTNNAGEVKYFNTITGWKVEKLDGTQVNQNNRVSENTSSVDDDLPF